MVLRSFSIARCLGICIFLNPSHSLILPAGRIQTRIRAPSLNCKPLLVATVDDLNLVEPDYLVTDSLELSDSERPSLSDFIRDSPQEFYLRFPLILSGTVLSVCNVVGYYEEQFYANIVLLCVGLGVCNAIADLTYRDISKNIRRGSIDQKVLQVYAGTYTASVSWLALRVYPETCPGWLPAFDPVMGWASTLIFAGSLISPLLSLWSDTNLDNSILQGIQLSLLRFVRSDSTIKELPPFTPTEKYRATSLVAIGIVASLYLPVSTYLALYGESWWNMSLESYPQQGLLESSTALFGLIAAQANISITNAARYGVKPLIELVNLGTAVSFLLAVVPCVCALYFLQDGITFFDHYSFHSS